MFPSNFPLLSTALIVSLTAVWAERFSVILCVRGTFRVSRSSCVKASPPPPYLPPLCDPSAILAKHGAGWRQGEAASRHRFWIHCSTAASPSFCEVPIHDSSLCLHQHAAAVFSPALTHLVGLCMVAETDAWLTWPSSADAKNLKPFSPLRNPTHNALLQLPPPLLLPSPPPPGFDTPHTAPIHSTMSWLTALHSSSVSTLPVCAVSSCSSHCGRHHSLMWPQRKIFVICNHQTEVNMSVYTRV